MNTLLKEILQWMQMNNYRRASFDRLVGIIPSAATYDQLRTVLNSYPNIFRSATMKGGLPGLALQDWVNPAQALADMQKQEEEVNIYNQAPTPPVLKSLDDILAEPKTVTPEAIEREIHSEDFIHVGEAVGSPVGPLGRLTLCVIQLKNEFTVVGKSACVYPEKYDRAVGEKLAREDAIRQIWPFLGFRMADERTRITF